jgi:hypothetical protein
VDQTQKYGSWTTSGTAGGRNDSAALADAAGKVREQRAMLQTARAFLI